MMNQIVTEKIVVSPNIHKNLLVSGTGHAEKKIKGSTAPCYEGVPSCILTFCSCRTSTLPKQQVETPTVTARKPLDDLVFNL